MSSSITVFCAITSKNGERVPLQLSTTSTCTDLRQHAAEVTKIPLDELRLIFRGKMIKDDTISAVDTYKLEPDCVLHCMGKPIETTASTSATPAASLPAVAAAVPTIPVASASSPPAPVVDPLQTALQQLRSFNSPQIYATALSTLAKILANIADHPMEDKYRKVKQQNVAFAKRLGGLNGGDAAMRAVGFILEQQEGVPVYQLHASPEAWPRLMAVKATIDAASLEAERLLIANTTPPPVPFAGMPNNPFGGGGGGGGLPGMGALPGADAINNNPAMQAALANMLSNPEAMRTMLQNPMVQQMIQNDPNVPPSARNAMQQLANNPAMLNQLSTMMNDPAMRAQLQTMMGSGAMPGIGGPSAMGNYSRPPAAQPPAFNNSTTTNSNNNNNNNNSQINDQQQTEEEMIAEAIRRSLEES